MSRARCTYTICYVLMILALACYLVTWTSPRATTPQEQWQSFHPWLGPAPQQLQAEEWRRESDDMAGIIFTFRADDDWREQIVHHFALADKDRGAAPVLPTLSAMC